MYVQAKRALSNFLSNTRFWYGSIAYSTLQTITPSSDHRSDYLCATGLSSSRSTKRYYGLQAYFRFLALYPYTENVIIILTNKYSIRNSRWLTHVDVIQLLSDFKALSLLDSLFADVKTCNVIDYRYNSSLSCKDTLLPKIS